MARPVDENDLTNAMDVLRQEMNAIQDKALKLVDKKMGGMITDKATSLMADVMTSVYDEVLDIDSSYKFLLESRMKRFDFVLVVCCSLYRF